MHWVYVICTFFLFVVQRNCQAQTELQLQAEKCSYAPGFAPKNRRAQLHCCNITDEWMQSQWKYGAVYLTTYLLTLKSWQCPQFVDECRKPTFALNPFSKHVYLYFCNRAEFETSCRNKISQLLPSTSQGKLSDWNTLVNQVNSRSLNVEQLLQPCTQVALFHKESTDSQFGKFHEAVTVYLPFCELNWCGTDDVSYRRGVISIWNCMSPRCRANIVIIFSFFALLTSAIITANATVIAVLKRSKKLRNSQAVYKASLALADLVVGVIVIPTFISTLGVLVWPPIEPEKDLSFVAYPVDNGSISENVSTNLSVPKQTGLFVGHLSNSYINFVGFFTLTSFTVSVYTLMIASIDRFKAVFKPLKYNHMEAKKLARILCAVIWVGSMLFAGFPLFIPNLNYKLIASILFASTGTDEVIILYAVAIIMPLLVVWITTVATFMMAKQHARARKHISARARIQSDTLENRLAKTLAIMVVVFTASLLPSIIVLGTSLGFDHISFSMPKRLDLTAGLAYASAEFVAVVILVSNSLWNVFIYSARNKEFRSEAREMYGEFAAVVGIAQCYGTLRDKITFYFYATRRRFSNLGRESVQLSGVTTTVSEMPSNNTTSTVPNSSTDSRAAKVVKLSDYSSSDQDVNGTLRAQAVSTTSNDDKLMKDSVFDSYVMDVNADRLFVSTMEILEEQNETQFV